MWFLSSIFVLVLSTADFGISFEEAIERCDLQHEVCMRKCNLITDVRPFINCRVTCGVEYNGCVEEVREFVPTNS